MFKRSTVLLSFKQFKFRGDNCVEFYHFVHFNQFILHFKYLFRFMFISLNVVLNRRRFSIKETWPPRPYSITYAVVTLNIFYCSILNNWIGHKFHNLETSSPIHTWINTQWIYIILYSYFILSEDKKTTCPFILNDTNTPNIQFGFNFLMDLYLKWVLIKVVNRGRYREEAFFY